MHLANAHTNHRPMRHCATTCQLPSSAVRPESLRRMYGKSGGYLHVCSIRALANKQHATRRYGTPWWMGAPPYANTGAYDERRARMELACLSRRVFGECASIRLLSGGVHAFLYGILSPTGSDGCNPRSTGRPLGPPNYCSGVKRNPNTPLHSASAHPVI